MPHIAPSFTDKVGRFSDDAERQIRELVETEQIKHVRLCWGDQHGIVRSKSVSIMEFYRCLREGKDFQLLSIFDSASNPIVQPFSDQGFPGALDMSNLPDRILVLDPSTFRKLPWLRDTGWILGDLFCQDGSVCPLCSRGLLRTQISRLIEQDFDAVIGLEFELHIYRPGLDNGGGSSLNRAAGSSIGNVTLGRRFLSETQSDQIDDLIETLRINLLQLRLPLATIEVEFGPSQIEVTFAPMSALEAADAALLFRSAMTQICRRAGLLATFMAKPHLAGAQASGWHLHQSLRSLKTGSNLFCSADDSTVLSPMGLNYLAGLLKYAQTSMLLTTPTVNGYKRYQVNGLAPSSISWGTENRSAMLRVIDAGQASCHIENRVGDPSANPYLYIASQLVSGCLGIAQKLQPRSPITSRINGAQEPIPHSLMDAIAMFEADKHFQKAFSQEFSAYFLALKQHELARFLSSVTDWEHNEYFSLF